MTDFPSANPADAPREPFERLCWIMDRLLAPGGCPWDREQSHESIKQYLIEEAYEVVDAIENDDAEELREELGDVALQVVFHAALARRAGKFDIDAVLEGVCDKLIRRHPHVFGEAQVDGSGQVLTNWEQIKQGEKAKKEKPASLLSGVPNHLPALQKAHRMQEKAARVGFDWDHADPVFEKVREEFEELAHARATHDRGAVTEEMGDLLFALVNAARFLDVQPEEALQSACKKFARRFAEVEAGAKAQGRALQDMTLAEMDALWDEAKKGEQEKD